MTSIHTILRLNTKAVAAYEAGENECAVALLIDALRLLPEVFTSRHGDFIRPSSDAMMHHDATKTTVTSNDEACRNHEIQFHSHSSYSVHPKFICSQDRIHSRETIEDHHSHIYHGAFLIDVRMSMKAKEMTAVMLYNVALALHNVGINRNQSSTLARALSFYRQASAFITHETQSYSSPTIYVLLAAIQTNTSHILNEFFLSDHNVNEAIVDRLVLLLMHMERTPTIRQRDIKFFQCAVTFINLTYVNNAPAA